MEWAQLQGVQTYTGAGAQGNILGDYIDQIQIRVQVMYARTGADTGFRSGVCEILKLLCESYKRCCISPEIGILHSVDTELLRNSVRTSDART